MTIARTQPQQANRPAFDLLCCPETGAALVDNGQLLCTAIGDRQYRINPRGVPIFADLDLAAEAQVQQQHYDKIAQAYVTNLGYPHTKEYMVYLDRVLMDVIDRSRLDTVAELCCGHGEAFKLLRGRFRRGYGLDISETMLNAAVEMNAGSVTFVQGDATCTPFISESFDSVFMLGGVHHVNDRAKLFREVHRILKPGGCFYFREPVNDFVLWRWLRSAIYRLSPALDHETERPLQRMETITELTRAGLSCHHYRTHGFLGFCLFMNSDVLVFNRLFQYVPGIRAITRAAARFDHWITERPGLHHIGLQVIGSAVKPPN
jgi:ubiquinone/menaquinone biosynthesis C-methylase UbiE